MCIRDRYQRRVHGITKKIKKVHIVITKISTSKKTQYILKKKLLTLLKIRKYLIKKLANVNYKIKKIRSLLSIKKTKKFIKKRIPKIWLKTCLLYTSPSPRDLSTSRMPSSA
eukprot:TRINITY_DN14156_c0_g1_i5.p4 TRINITY_DN14156_c0_g1~~TRINITY_DN14156_c0_g1_i5.p4  ORF type:complete len:112 (-),score=35.61 TRINITY_DN14156_c0_g1_i5:118-453(-)